MQAAPTPSQGWPQGTAPGRPAGMGVATRGRPAPGSSGPRPSRSRTPQLGGRVPARQPVLQGRPRRSLEAAPACALRVLGWQTQPHVAPGLCGKLHSDRLTRRSPDRWRGRRVQIASPRCPHRRPRLLTRPPAPRRAAAGEGFNCSSSRALLACRLIDQGARGPVQPVVCGWTFQAISPRAPGRAPGTHLSPPAPAGAAARCPARRAWAGELRAGAAKVPPPHPPRRPSPYVPFKGVCSL